MSFTICMGLNMRRVELQFHFVVLQLSANEKKQQRTRTHTHRYLSTTLPSIRIVMLPSTF